MTSLAFDPKVLAFTGVVGIVVLYLLYTLLGGGRKAPKRPNIDMLERYEQLTCDYARAGDFSDDERLEYVYDRATRRASCFLIDNDWKGPMYGTYKIVKENGVGVDKPKPPPERWDFTTDPCKMWHWHDRTYKRMRMQQKDKANGDEEELKRIIVRQAKEDYIKVVAAFIEKSEDMPHKEFRAILEDPSEFQYEYEEYFD